MPTPTEALKVALAALNTAPRFKVRSLPRELDDSYKIAAMIDKLFREPKPHGQIYSSNGEASFDMETGRVFDAEFEASEEWPLEHHPAIINVVELAKTYPGPLDTSWDILDLGYITIGGGYEAPCQDWRDGCKNL